MHIITNFTDFLVSAWLWNLTFAFSYVFIVGFLMALLFFFVARESLIRSLLLSFCAQIVTIILFSGVVVGLIIHLFNWQYVPGEISDKLTGIDALRACLSLGIVYALIQTLFFWVIRSYVKGSVITHIILTWFSNGIASFLCYWLIKWAMGTLL